MVSFIPQAIKSYKTKSVEDLSVWMIVATFIGTVFWIIYGYLIKSNPVLIMNIIFILRLNMGNERIISFRIFYQFSKN